MDGFDVIVIGLGPCGIQSAIQAKRLGLNVLVIGRDFGSLTKASKVENYFGIESISGYDLVLKGIKQAQDLEIVIIRDEVLEINMNELDFTISTTKTKYIGKTIMLATGKSRNKLTLASNFEGKGVSYCANCDGFFYSKKNIAIVGNNSFMKHELDFLLSITDKITVFTNGKELEIEISPTINVIKDKLVSFDGDSSLEGLSTSEKNFSFDGVFIAEGFASGFSFAKHLGIEMNGDSIVVDEFNQTNIPGIFAGGDTIGGVLQVAKAVGDGIKAANAIFKYLKSKKD